MLSDFIDTTEYEDEIAYVYAILKTLSGKAVEDTEALFPVVASLAKFRRSNPEGRKSESFGSYSSSRDEDEIYQLPRKDVQNAVIQIRGFSRANRQVTTSV